MHWNIRGAGFNQTPWHKAAPGVSENKFIPTLGVPWLTATYGLWNHMENMENEMETGILSTEV